MPWWCLSGQVVSRRKCCRVIVCCICPNTKVQRLYVPPGEILDRDDGMNGWNFLVTVLIRHSEDSGCVCR